MTIMDTTKLVEELSRDEGVRMRPYLDTVGKTTIGVGRNLTDVGLSLDEVLYLLRNDINRVQFDLDAHLPWWRKLDEVRQRVIANMAFNMGIHGLLSFSNTLEFVRCGQYADAADHMMQSKWARQVGPRAQRLADLMRDGEAGPAIT